MAWMAASVPGLDCKLLDSLGSGTHWVLLLAPPLCCTWRCCTGNGAGEEVGSQLCDCSLGETLNYQLQCWSVRLVLSSAEFFEHGF